MIYEDTEFCGGRWFPYEDKQNFFKDRTESPTNSGDIIPVILLGDQLISERPPTICVWLYLLRDKRIPVSVVSLWCVGVYLYTIVILRGVKEVEENFILIKVLPSVFTMFVSPPS